MTRIKKKGRGKSGGLSFAVKGLVALLIIFAGCWALLANHLVDDYVAQGGKMRLLDSSIITTTASAVDAYWEEGRWKPVDCHKLISDVRQGRGPVTDPNDGKLYATLTKMETPFWINVHNGKFDGARLAVWETGKYYEQALTQVFHDILKEAPPNARVLDVGGNIGWYTMLSASMGHHVDVFEPNWANILRQCQSKWLNNWPTAAEAEIRSRTSKRSSFNIHPYGVAEKESIKSMYYGNNPGMGSFINTHEFFPRGKNLTVINEIPLVSLDTMARELGWFDSNNKPTTKFAILKIDVEGYEPPTIAGAPKLLKSGMVDNVLMELTGRDDNTENEEAIANIVKAGFVLHKTGRYSGPDKNTNLQTNDDLPKLLVAECAPSPRKQCNLWWKFKGKR